MECVFIVLEYNTGSENQWLWDTDGEKEAVETPVDGHHCLYWRIRVHPGQHLFHRRLGNELKGRSQNFRALVKVPRTEERFQAFCAASAVASEAVYERILSYKTVPGPPRYDYTNDFPGIWLDPFIVKTWRNDPAAPANVQEALARLT